MCVSMSVQLSMHYMYIYTFDEEGVVAALPQFHHDIEQGGDGGSGGRGAFGQKHEVLLQNGSIVLLLNGRQLHLQIYVYMCIDINKLCTYIHVWCIAQTINS